MCRSGSNTPHSFIHSFIHSFTYRGGVQPLLGGGRVGVGEVEWGNDFFGFFRVVTTSVGAGGAGRFQRGRLAERGEGPLRHLTGGEGGMEELRTRTPRFWVLGVRAGGVGSEQGAVGLGVLYEGICQLFGIYTTHKYKICGKYVCVCVWEVEVEGGRV